MDENEFSFETIHQIVLKEKKYKQATKLDASFWERSQGLLDQYKQSYQDELAKNPGSFLTVELAMNIRKLLQQIDHVYRLRERKVLILALEKIDNPTAMPKNLLPLEEELLDRTVALLAHNRELTQFSNESSFLENLPPQINMASYRNTPGPDRELTEPVPDDGIPLTEMGTDGQEGTVVSEKEPPETPVSYEAREDFNDYVRVRITKGDREQNFVGLDDHNYVLRKEDLLYLPRDSGDLLVKGDHAEIV